MSDDLEEFYSLVNADINPEDINPNDDWVLLYDINDKPNGLFTFKAIHRKKLPKEVTYFKSMKLANIIDNSTREVDCYGTWAYIKKFGRGIRS